MLVVLTQTALLGVTGAYIPALYSVWPYLGTLHGHPVCEHMVDRCYCQESVLDDIFSSIYFPREMNELFQFFFCCYRLDSYTFGHIESLLII